MIVPTAAGGGVDTTPDPAGHAGFFLLGSIPEPHTAYRGIRALPPGSWLRVGTDGRHRTGHFFRLPEVLREAKVGLCPGVAFGPGGEGHFRICFGVDPRLLEEAMGRLVGHLAAAVP